jgi:hypothetical protein
MFVFTVLLSCLCPVITSIQFFAAASGQALSGSYEPPSLLQTPVRASVAPAPVDATPQLLGPTLSPQVGHSPT